MKVDQNPEGDARFRVAVAQCISLPGAVESNLEVARVLCAEASSLGADLILFPEGHAAGYTYENMADHGKAAAEALDGPIGSRLLEFSREFSMVVCCGMFEIAEGRYFNTHAVAFPDGRLEGQRKGLLSPAESWLDRDESRCVFEWQGHRFGILVCADSALPGYRSGYREGGVSLILHPSAGRILRVGREADEELQREAWRSLEFAQAFSREMNAAYAVANPIGFNGTEYYPGNSWIIGPQSGVLARLPASAIPERMHPSVAVAPLH